MPTTLGARIKARRDELGASQPEVAELLGVPQATVSRWERDAGAPRDEHIPGIAKWLGVDDRAVIEARYESARRRRAGDTRTPLQQCHDQLREMTERVRSLESELRQQAGREVHHSSQAGT